MRKEGRFYRSRFNFPGFTDPPRGPKNTAEAEAHLGRAAAASYAKVNGGFVVYLQFVRKDGQATEFISSVAEFLPPVGSIFCLADDTQWRVLRVVYTPHYSDGFMVLFPLVILAEDRSNPYEGSYQVDALMPDFG